MTNKIFDGEFIASLLHTTPDDVRIGWFGGRYVMVGTQKMNLNAIVNRVITWWNHSSDLSEKRTVLAKILLLDDCHPEYDVALFRKLLTYVRQFFGNMFYERHDDLEMLEIGLRIASKPVDSAPKLSPATDVPVKRVTDKPDKQPKARKVINILEPISSIPQPRAKPAYTQPVTTDPRSGIATDSRPKKPIEIKRVEISSSGSPLPAPSSSSAQSPPLIASTTRPTPKNYSECIKYYKEWRGEEPLPKYVIQELFPMIAGTLPFCFLQPPRISLMPLTEKEQEKLLTRTQSMRNLKILVPCLMDRILLLNGYTEEKQINEIKYAIYYGKNFGSVTNYETFIKDLMNSELSVRYIKDSLIIFTLQAMKTPILEACLTALTPASLNSLLNGYSDHYLKVGLMMDLKDASLELMIKHCVLLILKRKGEGLQKEILIKAFSAAMNAQGTIEIAWIGKEIANLQKIRIGEDEYIKFFTDVEIREFIKTYKKYHTGYINNHDVYITLRSLLPEDQQVEIIRQTEEERRDKDVARHLPPPKQWVPRPKQTLERTISTPVFPSPRTTSEPPPKPKAPDPTASQSASIEKYKTQPLNIKTIQLLIVRELTFEPTSKNLTTVQNTIRLITGKYDIDLTNDLTIQILGDIFASSINRNNVKNEIIKNWLLKIRSESINKLLTRYFQTFDAIYGDSPHADESPKLFLLELRNGGWKKRLQKDLAIRLVKQVAHLNEGWVATVITELGDHRIIDDNDKNELASLHKSYYSLAKFD